MKKLLIAGLLAIAATGAQAATYNFKAAANSGGGIGEAIYTTFNTNSFFTGPNLAVTATAGSKNAFVYFDAGNAGIGVCKTANALGTSTMNKASNGGTNRCAPSSDDGMTAVNEALKFTSTSGSVLISSIWINSNHDGGMAALMKSIWSIGGTIYSAANGVANSVSQSGDLRFDVNIRLTQGQSLNLFGTKSPDSYVSAISVSAVPIPAAGLLLLGAVGGLAAMRRKRVAA